MDRSSLLVPRSEWGAKPPAYPVTFAAAKNLFLCHHSGAAGSWPTPAEEIAAMRFWQAYHQGPGVGGADIFYGAVIFPSGRAYEGRQGGWLANNGGAYGCNSRGFGVCLAGDFTHEFPSLEALETLVKIGIEAREVLAIHPDRYWGHRDCYIYDARNRGNSCPGERFYGWLPVLRAVVAARASEKKEEDEDMIVGLQAQPKQGGLFVWVAPDAFTRIENPRHRADYLCWVNIYNESPTSTEIQLFGSPQLAVGHPVKATVAPYSKAGFDIFALNGGKHFSGSLILKSPKDSLAASLTLLRLAP